METLSPSGSSTVLSRQAFGQVTTGGLPLTSCTLQSWVSASSKKLTLNELPSDSSTENPKTFSFAQSRRFPGSAPKARLSCPPAPETKKWTPPSGFRYSMSWSCPAM